MIDSCDFCSAESVNFCDDCSCWVCLEHLSWTDEGLCPSCAQKREDPLHQALNLCVEAMEKAEERDGVGASKLSLKAAVLAMKYCLGVRGKS